MGVIFNRAGAYNLIATRVDTGIENTLGRIQGHAKSHAPVRKVRRGQRTRNLRNPMLVRFYRRSDGRRVDTPEALAQIGAQFKTPATGEQVAAVINNGGRDRHDTFGETVGPPNARRMLGVRRAMAKAGLTAKLATRKVQTSYSAKRDVARLHGVVIDTDSGEAFLGGTLRKSIMATDVMRQGKKISGSVRANAPYAKYVEFPTARTKAQPFLLPAFKKWGSRDALRDEIKKVGGG